MPKPISTAITADDLKHAFDLESEKWETAFTAEQIAALLPRVSAIRVWLAMQTDLERSTPTWADGENGGLHPALFEAALLCPAPKGKAILTFRRFEHELGRAMKAKYAPASKA